MGTPFCGKGEPNQVIRCGHASPGLPVFRASKSSAARNARARFLELADFVQSLAAAGEVIASGFAAESSDFIRFNKSAVRQATTVRQARWTLTLIRDGRRVDATATLSGQAAADREQLKAHARRPSRRHRRGARGPVPALPDRAREYRARSPGEIPDASRS